MSRARAVSVLGVVAALVHPTPGGAEPCPIPFVYGPDEQLVSEVKELLPPPASASSPKGCAPLTVQLTRDGEGVHLLRDARGVPFERVVRSPATAAILVASWTTLGAEELIFEPLPAVEPTRSEPTTRAPVAAAARPSAAPRARAPLARAAPDLPELYEAPPLDVAHPLPPSSGPKARTRTSPSFLSAGLIGIATQAARPAPGFEAAWTFRSDAWRLGPIARVHYDRQEDGLLQSGARAYDFGLGFRGGYRFGDDAVGITPAATLGVGLRHINPTQPVGLLTCGVSVPCGEDTPEQLPSPAYGALTLWLGLGATADWWFSKSFGMAVGAQMAVNPGYEAPDEPGGLFSSRSSSARRLAPEKPRWRATTRVALLWEGP